MSRTLSIALACVLVLGCPRDDQPVADAPPVGDKPVDYQKLADETPWKWEPAKASLAYCVAHVLPNYQVEIIRPPSKTFLPDHRLKIRILDNGREVYSCGAHWRTVFTQVGQERLFVAQFGTTFDGCTIVAVDLKKGKELWHSRLKATSPRMYSKFSNRVTIETDRKVLTVHGHESFGDYLEFVDVESGKTLGHREFPYKE